MTMTVRKQLSAVAWGASAFCALVLLLSAQAAVSHCISATHNTASGTSISVDSNGGTH